MLMPRQCLDIFAKGMCDNEERENTVSMADEHLRNHRDAATETAAVALFESAANEDRHAWRELEHATLPKVQVALHRALELNNHKLYRQVARCALKWLDTQETVLNMVGRHLEQGRYAEHPETIEWDTW